MNEETVEWLIVEELYEGHLDDMTDAARTFVKTLHDNLDPFEPFNDQVEGNPEKQRTWLMSLYEKHLNQDEEAAQDVWES